MNSDRLAFTKRIKIRCNHTAGFVDNCRFDDAGFLPDGTSIFFENETGTTIYLKISDGRGDNENVHRSDKRIGVHASRIFQSVRVIVCDF